MKRLQLLTVFIFLCVLNSCNDKIENELHSSSSELIEYKLNGETHLASKLSNIGAMKDDFELVSFMNISMDNNAFEDVGKFIKSTTSKNFEGLYMVVLYSKTEDVVEFNSELLTNDMIGISLYQITPDSRLIHKYLENQGGEFKMDNDFSLSASTVTTRQLTRMALNKVDAKSFVILNNEDFTPNISNFDDGDELALKEAIWVKNAVNNYLSNKSSKTFTDDLKKVGISVSSESGKKNVVIGCSWTVPGCERDTGHPTCNATGHAGTYDCRPHPFDCGSNSAKSQFQNDPVFVSNLPKDNFKSQQDMETYLNKTVLGSKYNNYYRAMSSYISNKHTLPLVVKTLKTLPTVNKMQDRIVNGNHLKGSIINDNEKEELISLMEDYKETYSNDDFKDIIEDLEKDIESFSNLSSSKRTELFN